MRPECLAAGLAEPVGVWGGTTPAERSAALAEADALVEEALWAGRLAEPAPSASEGERATCGRRCAGAAGDRLRMSLCPGCYVAWLRAGRPSDGEGWAASAARRRALAALRRTG